MDYSDRLKILFILIIILVPSWLCTRSSAEPLVGEVNAKEQAKIMEGFKSWYQTINTMRVEFRQITLNKTWGEEMVANGIFLFKKPGLMHWEYRSPQQDIVIVNAEHIWWYIPEDKQVVKSESGPSETITPISLLGKELNIEKNFNIIDFEKKKLEEEKGEKIYVFSLEPKEPHQSAKKIILEISSHEYSLSAIEVIDPLSNSNRIEFISIAPNVAIDDAQFIFKPSPGIKVITQPKE
ncbi:MAG: LolA family protein [bacterium]